jgi:two-component system, NtrC family, response regulator AtoC
MATGPAHPSVLIIDDDPAVLGSLARALASESFLVRTAANAAEGVLRFAVAEPDIILLDLTMPGENGWETFEEISRQSPLVPVVIITAQPGQFETARAACVAALVEKPIDIASLVAIMRRLLAEDETTRLARLTHHSPATRLVRPDRSLREVIP